MANYELWLTSDTGTRLALLDTIESLEYSMAVHQIGVCTLVLPGNFDRSLVAADRKIEIWRAPDGGSLSLERAYMLRRLHYQTDKTSKRTILLTGYDGNYLLDGRIVAYASGSSAAKKTAAADDAMKAVVREAMGSTATDTSRRWNSSYFSVQADASDGPSITLEFSRREVLSLLQQMAEASKQTGPDTFFDVWSPSPSEYEFVTNTGQLGLDHTYPDGVDPVILSIEFGNLAETELDEDYTDEANFVYAGGNGFASDRQTVTVEDTARSGRSIWGRREAWAEATGQDTDGLTASANARLGEGKPKIRFSGKIVETEGMRYGIHWRFGDKLSAVDDGQQYDCIARAVRVRLDRDGSEEIEAMLGYEA